MRLSCATNKHKSRMSDGHPPKAPEGPPLGSGHDAGGRDSGSGSGNRRWLDYLDPNDRDFLIFPIAPNHGNEPYDRALKMVVIGAFLFVSLGFSYYLGDSVARGKAILRLMSYAEQFEHDGKTDPDKIEAASALRAAISQIRRGP
jgi:hypothetical protein